MTLTVISVYRPLVRSLSFAFMLLTLGICRRVSLLRRINSHTHEQRTFAQTLTESQHVVRRHFLSLCTTRWYVLVVRWPCVCDAAIIVCKCNLWCDTGRTFFVHFIVHCNHLVLCNKFSILFYFYFMHFMSHTYMTFIFLAHSHNI